VNTLRKAKLTTTLAHDESRTWLQSVISNQLCWGKIRVYLLLQFFHLNLVVVNGRSRLAMDIGTALTLAMADTLEYS
jgi:hypothetical protein